MTELLSELLLLLLPCHLLHSACIGNVDDDDDDASCMPLPAIPIHPWMVGREQEICKPLTGSNKRVLKAELHYMCEFTLSNRQFATSSPMKQR